MSEEDQHTTPPTGSTPPLPGSETEGDPNAVPWIDPNAGVKWDRQGAGRLANKYLGVFDNEPQHFGFRPKNQQRLGELELEEVALIQTMQDEIPEADVYADEKVAIRQGHMEIMNSIEGRERYAQITSRQETIPLEPTKKRGFLSALKFWKKD